MARHYGRPTRPLVETTGFVGQKKLCNLFSMQKVQSLNSQQYQEKCPVQP